MKKSVLTACWVALAATVSTSDFALAQAAAKQTPARSVPVKKVFPYYDLYLSLPGDGRDGFRMVYKIAAPAGSPRPQMTYALGALRTPVEVAGTGQIINLPDSNMLSNGRIDIAANQPRAGITMDLEPIIPLSRVISFAAATNPLTDYSNAIRRAGPLAAFAPKLKGVVFRGVTSGEAVFADGRRVALPSSPRGIVFQPSAPALRGAVSLAFATPPTDSEFAL
jgi:hypothetical protein